MHLVNLLDPFGKIMYTLRTKEELQDKPAPFQTGFCSNSGCQEGLMIRTVIWERVLKCGKLQVAEQFHEVVKAFGQLDREEVAKDQLEAGATKSQWRRLKTCS